MELHLAPSLFIFASRVGEKRVRLFPLEGVQKGSHSSLLEARLGRALGVRCFFRFEWIVLFHLDLIEFGKSLERGIAFAEIRRYHF